MMQHAGVQQRLQDEADRVLGPASRPVSYAMAGEQDGQHVAEDLPIAERLDAAFLCHDHRIEEACRRTAAGRLGLETGATRHDHVAGQPAHLGDRAVEFAIGGQLEIAPPGDGREDAADERREDAVQVLLDVVPGVRQGVEIAPEGESGGDVHGEAHQIGTQVDRRPCARGPFPTLLQACGDVLDTGEVATQVIGIERVHHELALPPPIGALGVEHAVDAHLAHRPLRDRRAPERVRSPPQHVVHRLRVGNHQQSPPPQGHRVDRTVAVGPVAELTMETVQVDLQHAADQREPARPAQGLA